MEKQDFLIIGACLVLLFLWFTHYAPRGTPPPPQKPAVTDTYTPAGTKQPIDGSDAPDATAPPEPANERTVAFQSDATSAYSELEPAASVELTIDGLTSLTVNPETGGIEEAVLTSYPGENGMPVMTLGHAPLPMLAVRPANRLWTFSHAKVEKKNGQEFGFSRAIESTALVLTQFFAPNPESDYAWDYVVTLTNTGGATVELDDVQVNCGTMLPLNTSKGFMGAGGYDQRVDFLPSGKKGSKAYIVDKVRKLQRKPVKLAEMNASPVDWVAVQNKYFAVIVSVEEGFSGFNPTTEPLEADNEEDAGNHIIMGAGYLPPFALAPGESKVFRLNVYIGPKQYTALKQLGGRKESVMQFDNLFLIFHFKWMEWISLLIFRGLILIGGLTHSYGLAIVFLTLIIRTIFWPITHKSTVWSKRMQKIQPLAQELREKYKSDPQKMQQKTFELYREHKINPLTGCFPVFVQIPVFFALFNVLRNAIELRQEGFLWAKDLSQPDTIGYIFSIPFNPLALMMGVTMFIQQKMMPTSVDPAQQKMMMAMTLFFVFICYTMPSGIALYWTINQMVSIFQYYVTQKIMDEKDNLATATAGKS